MLDQWIQLIQERRQYDGWDLEKECPEEIIMEILEEQNTFAPKKINESHFEMILVSGFDEDIMPLRKLIYDWSILDEPGVPYAINPQTLAHHLLIFKLKENQSDEDDEVGRMQIGLAMSYIVLGATARGLQSGFCRCFDRDNKILNDSIEYSLGIRHEKKIEVILGVGYGSSNNTMINPTNGETIPTPARTYPESSFNPIPPLSTYFTKRSKS